MSALIGVGGMFSFDADMPSRDVAKRIDWIGAALVTIGLVLIVFVLGRGELAPQGWKTPCETARVMYCIISKFLCDRHQISLHFLSSGLSWWCYSCVGSDIWNKL